MRVTNTLRSTVGVLAVLGLVLSQSPAQAKEASPALEMARQLNRAFVEVAEKVSPSVVVITVTQKRGEAEEEESQLIPDELRKFFRRQQPGNGQRRPQSRQVTGQGSGIIISKDGYILTNRHVVDGADKIKVTLKDKKVFTGTIRGVDADSDVAVIKIEPEGHPLVVAELADSTKTKVGEFAIAIGAPFDLDYSVTYGHVSAKGRRVLDDQVMMDQDFIQTDASINPGNSGGPLVNIEGEVIGINTLIRGMNTGIGFAIPSSFAKQVSDRLISDGKFTRSWLGISIQTLSEDPDLKDSMKGVKDGVVVRGIVPNGPAANSELEPADVITAVDGKAVSTVQDLKDEVRTKKIGQSVALDVVRDGKKLKFSVKSGELPEDRLALNRGGGGRAPAGTSESDDLGIKVKSITKEMADQYGLDRTEGVVVTEVQEGSPAEQKRIQPGDVITRIGKQPVASLRDFKAAVKDINLKKGVSVQIVGETGRRFEVLKSAE